MMPFQEWQATNDQYLSTRLAWLRNRIQSFIEQGSDPDFGSPPVEDRSVAEKNTDFVDASSSDFEPPIDSNESIDSVGPVNFDSENCPALEFLAGRLGLSDYEKNVILLCVAMEMDTRFPGLCQRLHGDLNKPFPTFSMCMALLDQPAWDAVSPERPLRKFQLIEIIQPSGVPLVASCLKADERIVNFVKGLNYLDDRLASMLEPINVLPENLQLPPSQESIVTAIVNSLVFATGTGRHLPVIQLLGSDSPGKRQVAERVAAEFGLRLQKLSTAAIPVDCRELDVFARLWERESLLLPLALYIDASDTSERGPEMAATGRLLSRTKSLVFLETRILYSVSDSNTDVYDVDKPTISEQYELWLRHIEESDKQLAAILASQFNLDCLSIHQIAERSQSGSYLHPVLEDQTGDLSSSTSSPRSIWETCCIRNRPNLEKLAQRIECKADWDHLVLPSEQAKLLQQIVGQVQNRNQVYEDWGFANKHNRGLGISVLFAGESGTGKTMAAEVIARELQLDLYRIDLSQVVNKYIGETEKSLRRLFDAADGGSAILFFDEADALFSKRTEVKDAHDRYANVETNFLLQQIESYRGLAILATNLKNSIDKAFLRRLRFVVDFSLPNQQQRLEMWQKAFPASTPLAALDYSRLSRLNLSGGNIHSIALNAAFTAAQRDSAVDMPAILDCAQSEFRKLQKHANASDFRWHSMEGAPA